MNKQSFALWFPLLILVVTFILNLLYYEPLYLLGESIICWAQKYSSPPLDAFFIFFTFLIQPFFVIASLMVGVTIFRKKLEGAVITVAVLFNTYIFMIMKAFLTSPRPFWTHSSIRNIGYYCPKDYGSPSGHTEFAVFIFLIYLFHFNSSRNLNIAVAGFGIIFLVMASRMYLGGHSLDQVVFGFIVASCLAVMYEFGGLRRQISQALVSFNKPAVKRVVVTLVVSAHALAGLVYFKNLHKDSGFLNSFKVWRENFREKCSFEISWVMLNESSLLAESVLMSFVLGYFFSFNSLLKVPGIANYLSGNWRINKAKYGLLSNPILVVISLVIFICPTIVSLPIFLLFKKVYLVKYLTANILALISPYFLVKLTFSPMRYFSLIELLPSERNPDLSQEERQRIIKVD